MTSPTDLPGMPPIPSPVTLERLVAMLGEQDWEVDREATTMRRRWERAEVVISLPRSEGSVVLFAGTRRGPAIPLGRHGDLQTFVNDWHRERIWPVVVLEAAATEVVVRSHVAVDATAGLTDAQLSEYVRIGIGTTHQCFSAMEEAGLAPPPVPGSADPDAG